ncbi:hypothetical protein B0H10DRAFT_1742385, partial [Mycena sp. CBHHK59/15]
IWTVLYEAALIEYLIEHLLEAGDGKHLNPTTFHGAAKHRESIRTEGGPKAYKSCSGKLNLCYVETIKGVSGWKWDAKKVADIGPEMQGNWD